MTSDAPTRLDPDLGRRRLPVWLFIVLAIVWLAIIKILGLVAHDKADADDGRMLHAATVFWALVLPIGVACVFVYALIAFFGFWRPLLHEPHRVQRWVWVIPIVFAVAILLGINYGGLADRGLGFTLTLLLAAMFVGFGEEGMFRCVGVVSLRQQALSEGKVALWSSVIFGLVHISNVIGGNATALAQAVIVSFAGYFFYLIRRVSGSNLLNSILHGLFDFTIITGTAIIPEGDNAYPGVVLAVLVYVVCGLILIIRRKRIELPR